MNKPLKNIFHINEQLFRETYNKRFTAPYTSHFDFEIKINAKGDTVPIFLCITKDMLLATERINRLTIDLERIIQPIPPIAIHQFFMSCLREEILATNAIEGVHSTRKEVNDAIDQQDNFKEKYNIRLWGIVNKYGKLLNKEPISFMTCADLRAFYNEFALDEVLKDNPANKPDGVYFRKGPVSVNNGMKPIHEGIFPEERIISCMETALNILNDQTIPILIRVSLYHYLFGYIHPFYDGNGRTSRFISSYYLSHYIHPLLGVRLSITIKKTKRVYYKLFDEANHPLNRGELTYFVTGFMSIIEKALQETVNILSQKASQYVDLLNKFPEVVKSKKYRKIYNILLQAALFSDNTGATVKEIAVSTQLHENTVQKHLQELQITTDHIIVHSEARAYRYELNLGNCFPKNDGKVNDK